MRSELLAIAVLAFSLLSGCAARPKPVELQLPNGMLQMRTSPAIVKATSPQDALLLVRRFRNRDKGSLEFWVEALQSDFVDNRGYAPVGSVESIACESGVGRIMEYDTKVDGQDVGYLVAVWVTDKAIVTAEFSARQDEWGRREDDIRAALTTLRFE